MYRDDRKLEGLRQKGLGVGGRKEEQLEGLKMIKIML